MVPKTALQKRVFSLSKKLPKISIGQVNYAKNNSFESYAVRSRKTLYCLECGSNWKDESELITALDGVVCPNCDKKLKMHNSYKPNKRDVEYMAILTIKEEYQVVRIVCFNKDIKKGEKPLYFHAEVMQHWIAPNGKVTSLSMRVNGFSQYYDQWIYSSDLTIMDNSFKDSNRYNINPSTIYCRSKILPIIKRNGFKGDFYDLIPHKLFSIILSNTYSETLLKTNQIEVLQNAYYSSDKIKKHWNSIKICIKNNYTINDFKDWVDYLDLLTFFGKDTRSVKYLCPSNFAREHNRYVSKKREIDNREEFEKMKEKIEKEEIAYSKEKGCFFGLVFTDGELTVKVIDSVKEIMYEGNELKHCVFTNRYHKKKDSLLLSAAIGEKRLETVEISLKDFNIKQSRGKFNQATEYNQKIIDLVTRNLQKIERANKNRTLKEAV
jgi:DNA-directed RNA polymerase subunit RPC12/RpoP